MKNETKLFDEWMLGAISCPMELSCISRPPAKQLAADTKVPYVVREDWRAVHADFAALIECITRNLEMELRKQYVQASEEYKGVIVVESKAAVVLNHAVGHPILREIVRKFNLYLCETREEFCEIVQRRALNIFDAVAERFRMRMDAETRFS